MDLANNLNTPRLVADASQNAVWKWDNQEPFGNDSPNQDPGNTGTPFNLNLRFPGQYADAEDNLAYNYFRDYSAELGRYIRFDPIGTRGGLNGYLYVSARPLRYVDVRGLAIGDFPPPPPGYNPQTWSQGQWPNGKYYLIDPDRGIWTVHPEDDGHWRHWDKQDSDGDDDGMWPPNSKKPWPGQKRLKPDQCTRDPNGSAPTWDPLDSDLPTGDPKSVMPFLPDLVNPNRVPPLRFPIRAPVLVP